MKESEASVAALSKQKAEVDAEKASVTRQIASATSTPVAEIGPSSGSAKKEPEAAKSAAVTAKAAGDTDGGKSNNVSSSGSTGGTNEFPAASNVTANKGKENAVVPAAASSASDPFAEDPFPAPTNVLTTKKAEATNVASKGGAVKASGAANNQHDDFPTVDPSFASFDAFPAPEEGATKSLSAASAVDGFGHVDFPPTPSKNKRLVSEDGFPESEFPPPSDFSSFGDFSGSFHEESFTSGTKNAPW